MVNVNKHVRLVLLGWMLINECLSLVTHFFFSVSDKEDSANPLRVDSHQVATIVLVVNIYV